MADAFVFARGVVFGLLLLLCMRLWIDLRHLLVGRLMLALLTGLGAYAIAPFLSAWPVVLYLIVAPLHQLTHFSFRLFGGTCYRWLRICLCQTPDVHNKTFELAVVSLFQNAYSGIVVTPTPIRPARNRASMHVPINTLHPGGVP